MNNHDGTERRFAVLKKYLMIAASLIIFSGILFTAYLFLWPHGPDLKKYEFLREPRLTYLPDQKMIEVRAIGDPNIVGRDAFGALFKTYFQLKRSAQNLALTAPRARWPRLPETPWAEWTGIYGMPVPKAVSALPEQDIKAAIKVELTMWEYGEVAEILHVGPYAEERATIEKLRAFIEKRGYEIIGPHEEEYLKGPGVFLRGDPKDYYTILRYRVRKLM
jgi:hypothetical protein